MESLPEPNSSPQFIALQPKHKAQARRIIAQAVEFQIKVAANAMQAYLNDQENEKPSPAEGEDREQNHTPTVRDLSPEPEKHPEPDFPSNTEPTRREPSPIPSPKPQGISGPDPPVDREPGELTPDEADKSAQHAALSSENTSENSAMDNSETTENPVSYLQDTWASVLRDPDVTMYDHQDPQPPRSKKKRYAPLGETVVQNNEFATQAAARGDRELANITNSVMDGRLPAMTDKLLNVTSVQESEIKFNVNTMLKDTLLKRWDGGPPEKWVSIIFQKAAADPANKEGSFLYGALLEGMEDNEKDSPRFFPRHLFDVSRMCSLSRAQLCDEITELCQKLFDKQFYDTNVHLSKDDLTVHRATIPVIVPVRVLAQAQRQSAFSKTLADATVNCTPQNPAVKSLLQGQHKKQLLNMLVIKAIYRTFIRSRIQKSVSDVRVNGPCNDKNIFDMPILANIDCWTKGEFINFFIKNEENWSLQVRHRPFQMLEALGLNHQKCTQYKVDNSVITQIAITVQA